MNIAFLNASISRTAGGVFEVERRLAQKLQSISGVDIQVFGLRDKFTDADLKTWMPLIPQVHNVTGPEGFGYSSSLVPALKRSGADLLHLQVLWMYPSVATLRVGKPYITTVHGMLDSWAVKNSRLKKAFAGTVYEKAALRKASCLHAFTINEYNDIRSFGLKNPVTIIPNGVDLPTDLSLLKKEMSIWSKEIASDRKVLLYLGRLHPKKGLINLINAWKLSANKDWALVIVGWGDEKYENELKRLVVDLKLQNDVFFLGPQFNKQKDLCYAHASAFILPSFSEGLPMAILEAWAYRLPTLMTPQCNLPEGYEVGSAIEIEPNTESISSGLAELFSYSSKELDEMGLKGQHLVSEKFTWEKVAKQMYTVYEWILNRGELPDTVIMN